MGNHPFSLAAIKLIVMFYVYVLVSQSRNYIYVGMTDNLIEELELMAEVTTKQPDFIDHFAYCLPNNLLLEQMPHTGKVSKIGSWKRISQSYPFTVELVDAHDSKPACRQAGRVSSDVWVRLA